MSSERPRRDEPSAATGFELDVLRRTLRSLFESASPEAFDELARLAVEAGDAALAEDVGRARGFAGQLAHHRAREVELNALLDTARDIARLRDTETLLRAVARRARQIAASDLAYISSIEDEAEQFVVRATEGCISRDFESMRVPRRHGMCGQVLLTGRPCISLEYLTDDDFNRHPQIDAIVHEEGIVSMLGVPLEIDGRVIGVLFVGHRVTHRFAPKDVAVLASLATLAAVTIRSARLFEETRRALAREQAANTALNERAAELHAAGEAHERLIELLVHDGGLDDLIGRIAELLACSAAVLDGRLRVLASAGGYAADLPTSPGDRAPQGSGALGDALRESAASGRSSMRHLADGSVCRVAPILGGNLRLGAVATWRKTDLTEPEIRTLERGAVLAAIMLLESERREETVSRDARETLASLLHATWEVSRGSRPRLEGHRLPWPLTLHLVDLDGLRPQQVSAAVKSLVKKHGAIASEYQADYAVLSGPRAGESFAEELQAAIEAETGIKASIAVSEPAKAADQLPDRHRKAQWTLRMLRTLGHGGQIGHERLFAVYAPLFRDKGRDDIAAFVEQAIGAIVRHDARHEAKLADTLLVFLDLGQTLQSTAKSLGIHVNTARQRLGTVRTLCPEWDVPTRLLETHLALRLHAMDRGRR